jgi:hypothetical protein
VSAALAAERPEVAKPLADDVRYLVTIAKIHALNAAGLDSLQISIDNLTPDDVSKTSARHRRLVRPR